MRTLDKLKNKIKVDKNLIIFLVVLIIIGVLAGSIFITVLNQSDKTLVQESLNNYINNIENNNLDYVFALKSNIISSIIFVTVLWLLGISVIGLPVIVIMFFIKAFLLGFGVGSMILTFNFKGIIPAVIYIFPGQVITIMVLLIVAMYAISFSLKLIYTLLKKSSINFKNMINRYVIILLLAIFIIITMTLYDTYCVPYLIKKTIHLIR